ncbi:MAG: hypothetical protein ABIE84_02740 [bacterium]
MTILFTNLTFSINARRAIRACAKSGQPQISDSKRRLFSAVGQVVKAAGLAYVAASAASCVNTAQNLQRLREQLTCLPSSFNNHQGYQKYLRPGEFIVPSEVLQAFRQLFDKDMPLATNEVEGVYLQKNFLASPQRQEQFRKNLIKLNLTDNQIESLVALFSSTDVIIATARIITENKFFDFLLHERMHQAMKRLTPAKRELLTRATKEVLSATDENFQPLITIPDSKQSKTQPVTKRERLIDHHQDATQNWEEFYTYLSQGSWPPVATQLLSSFHPEAYALYSRLKQACEVTGR